MKSSPTPAVGAKIPNPYRRLRRHAESIFISYRRTDSQHAVFAIADRLRSTFGPQKVFLDRSVIKPGDEWPTSLRRAVKGAAVVLPVIGERWLTTADESGRRRIDDENDWVRRERAAALAANAAKGTAIIPVLLENAKRLRAEAFDSSLQRLAVFEPLSLTVDKWEAGLEALILRVLRLALALLQASGFSHSGERLPAGQAKLRILPAVDQARACLPLRSFGFSGSRQVGSTP